MSKGEETRKAILERALGVAAELGLEAITIGTLAGDLGMSKSGLFAHFKSKEQLQMDVLGEAVDRFVAYVVTPALKQPRGEPRVRALVLNWIDWAESQPNGCLIHAASSELDDRPGPLRDFLQGAQRDLRDTIATAARISIAEGHFRGDLDPQQLAFEATSVALGYHHASRLLRDPKAKRRAIRALESLLQRARPLPMKGEPS